MMHFRFLFFSDSILNNNSARLANIKKPDTRGNIQVGEVLLGMTSGARAVVKDRRLITDDVIHERMLLRPQTC